MVQSTNKGRPGGTFGAGASCGAVESVGMEYPTDGSGGKSPDFDRLGTSIDRNGGKTPSGFCHSPVNRNDRLLNA